MAPMEEVHAAMVNRSIRTIKAVSAQRDEKNELRSQRLRQDVGARVSL